MRKKEIIKKGIYLLYIGFLSFPYLVQARDFIGSVEEASSSLKQVLAVVGVLALMIAGASFYFSKRIGMERLGSAIIGTIVFASSATVFSLIFRIFN